MSGTRTRGAMDSGMSSSGTSSSSDGEIDYEAERRRGLEAARAQRRKLRVEQQKITQRLNSYRHKQAVEAHAREENARAHVRASFADRARGSASDSATGRDRDDWSAPGWAPGNGPRAQPGLLSRWLEHERRWVLFEERQDKEHTMLGAADIPWPPSTEGLLESMTTATNVMGDTNSSWPWDPQDYDILQAYRQAYHKASRRWHPDKFLNRFGHLLALDASEEVLARVNSISQQVNREWQELKHT
mmetsp:Transcript_14411/g.40674  ORF Transcript_14411/g.40674 Transcript_14411/m.40674 type:complete len:245 (+) Transcript_14411:864-1598(+)